MTVLMLSTGRQSFSQSGCRTLPVCRSKFGCQTRVIEVIGDSRTRSAMLRVVHRNDHGVPVEELVGPFDQVVFASLASKL